MGNTPCGRRPGGNENTKSLKPPLAKYRSHPDVYRENQLSRRLVDKIPQSLRPHGPLSPDLAPSLTFRLWQGCSWHLEHPSHLCSPSCPLVTFQPAPRSHSPCCTPWQGGLVARVLLPFPKHPNLSCPVPAPPHTLQALIGGLAPGVPSGGGVRRARAWHAHCWALGTPLVARHLM